MGAVPKTPVTVDWYLAWAVDDPGRDALRHGTVIAMSPETIGLIDRTERRARSHRRPRPAAHHSSSAW